LGPLIILVSAVMRKTAFKILLWKQNSTVVCRLHVLYNASVISIKDRVIQVTCSCHDTGFSYMETNG